VPPRLARHLAGLLAACHEGAVLRWSAGGGGSRVESIAQRVVAGVAAAALPLLVANACYQVPLMCMDTATQRSFRQVRAMDGSAPMACAVARGPLHLPSPVCMGAMSGRWVGDAV
jgi:hypothetical protein